MPSIPKKRRPPTTSRAKAVVDFKKPKHKVGKKAKVGENATSTKFKVRNINIHEQLRDTSQLVQLTTHTAGTVGVTVADQSGVPTGVDHSTLNIHNVTTARKLTLTDLLGQLTHHNTTTVVAALNGIMELYRRYSSIRRIQHSFSAVHQHICELIINDNKLVRDTLLTLMSAILSTLDPAQLQPFITLYVQYINLAGNSIIRGVQKQSVQFLQLLVTVCSKDAVLSDLMWQQSGGAVHWLAQMLSTHLHTREHVQAYTADANKQISADVRAEAKYRTTLVKTVEQIVMLNTAKPPSSITHQKNKHGTFQHVTYTTTLDELLNQQFPTSSDAASDSVIAAVEQPIVGTLIEQWANATIPPLLDWYVQCSNAHNEAGNASMLSVLRILQQVCDALTSEQHDMTKYYHMLNVKVLQQFPYDSSHTRSLNLHVALLCTYFTEVDADIVTRIVMYINATLVHYSNNAGHTSNDHITSTFGILQRVIKQLSQDQQTALLHHIVQLLAHISSESTSKITVLDVVFQLVESMHSVSDSFVCALYDEVCSYFAYQLQHSQYDSFDFCCTKLQYLLNRYDCTDNDNQIDQLLHQVLAKVVSDNTINTSSVQHVLTLTHYKRTPFTPELMIQFTQFCEHTAQHPELMLYIIDLLHCHQQWLDPKDYVDMLLLCMQHGEQTVAQIARKLLSIDRNRMLQSDNGYQLSYFSIYQSLLIKLLHGNYRIQLPHDVVLQLTYTVVKQSDVQFTDISGEFVAALVSQLLVSITDATDKQLPFNLTFVTQYPQLLTEWSRQLCTAVSSNHAAYTDNVIRLFVHILSQVEESIELKPFKSDLTLLYQAVSTKTTNPSKLGELKAHLQYRVGAFD